MSTNQINNWLTVCAPVLMATAACWASGDPLATSARPENNYSGTVESINPKENTLTIQGFVFGKTFHLGDACACTLLGNRVGTVYDLRPGEKIKVSYQDVSGVLVADGVKEQAIFCEGTVKTIDPAAHTLTVRVHGADRAFQIPDGCNFFLRDGSAGSLGDIQTGNHVTVTYETPGATPTAWQIDQTSSEFTGKLTAMDLEENTLKARALFGSKEFELAEDCVVVMNGKPGGRLKDLQADEMLNVSYDAVDGVNVAYRIATGNASADESQTKPLASTPAPLTRY